jgi:hypothetical protein
MSKVSELLHKMFTAKNLVIVWMCGFGFAIAGQSVLQGVFASETFWGQNGGWQNEIAIWNCGMVLVLLGVVLSKKGVEPRVIPGLTILSLGFGINHLVAIIQSGILPRGHLLFVCLNFGAVGLAALYFIVRNKRGPQ